MDQKSNLECCPKCVGDVVLRLDIPPRLISNQIESDGFFRSNGHRHLIGKLQPFYDETSVVRQLLLFCCDVCNYVQRIQN
ncbi:MAG: hypothetical protein QMD77_00590 [Patescibacteria group bacterium]|nr:hypothetical protein [Patescibacteria group bacterium]